MVSLRRKEISKPRSIGLSESSARPLLSFLRLECSLASLGRQYCQVNRFEDLLSALDTPEIVDFVFERRPISPPKPENYT